MRKRKRRRQAQRNKGIPQGWTQSGRVAWRRRDIGTQAQSSRVAKKISIHCKLSVGQVFPPP